MLRSPDGNVPRFCFMRDMSILVQAVVRGHKREPDSMNNTKIFFPNQLVSTL